MLSTVFRENKNPGCSEESSEMPVKRRGKAELLVLSTTRKERRHMAWLEGARLVNGQPGVGFRVKDMAKCGRPWA